MRWMWMVPVGIFPSYISVNSVPIRPTLVTRSVDADSTVTINANAGQYDIVISTNNKTHDIKVGTGNTYGDIHRLFSFSSNPNTIRLYDTSNVLTETITLAAKTFAYIVYTGAFVVVTSR